MKREAVIGKSLLLVMLALAAFWDASALAQQAAPFDVYAIPVHVDQTAASANAARDAARFEGARHAYIRMLSRLTRASDAARLPPANDASLNDLIQGFEVANERRSDCALSRRLHLPFPPDAHPRPAAPGANSFRRSAVAAACRPAGSGGQRRCGPVLWDDPNPWRDAWNQANFPPGLVPLILPLGDAADLAAADAPAADHGDDAALASISSATTAPTCW